MTVESTAREGVEAADDIETLAEIEAVEGEETEVEEGAETEAEGQDGEGDEDGEQQETAEEIEFDFGGNKLKVPKGSIPEEVAEQLDKFTKGTWSDYTRKSQEIAETKKSLEARAGAVEKLVNLNGEALQTYSRGLQLRGELEQLQSIDLNALWQSDPDRARRVSDTLAQKQAEFQSIVSKVAQTEQQLTQTQQAEMARLADEGKQYMERRIKGWSEKVPDVIDYVVKNYGMTKEEAETWPLNPKTAEMAWKAMQFDRMQAQAKPKPAPKAAPAAPVKPMKAKGAATAQKDPDKMSVEEWVKWRESQVRKRG